MPFSIIGSQYEYNQETWVVSLINIISGTAGATGGHAVIVVEGIDANNNVFQGEYDITAIVLDDTRDSMQEACGNYQGVIDKIRCNPSATERSSQQPVEFKRNYEDHQYSHKCWYVSPVAAQAMIQEIENDAAALTEAVGPEEDFTKSPFKYQVAGSSRFSLLGGNQGDNCVTWAEKKLAVAGVGNGVLCSDSSKAAPSSHTSRFCMLL